MAPEMNWKQQVLTCWLKHQKTLPERYRLSLPTKSVERQVWTKNERRRGLVVLLKTMKPLEEDFPEIDDPVPANMR